MNIKDVAKEAGVSITTASRVLNNPDAVSKKTRQKVMDVMHEMDYTPNWFAQNLHSNRTNIIGMLIPDTLNPADMEIAKGVEKIAHQNNCSIILCSTDYDNKIEKEYIKTLINRKTDGLILVSPTLQKNDLAQLKAKKMPFVIVAGGNYWDCENVVYTDSEASAYEIIVYLIDMGRRSIAIVLTDKALSDNTDKLKGYERAMVSMEIPLHADYTVRTQNTIEGGFIAASKLLESENRPDAIFFATDTMAFGGIECMKQNGLTPDELSIVGFDDLKVGAVMEPKLTTVTKPSYRMGLTAARLLFDLIDGVDENDDYSDEPQAIMLQSRLKIRKSCGNKVRLKEIW